MKDLNMWNGVYIMKIQRKLVAAISMLLIMTGGFSALDVKADDFSEEVHFPAEAETIRNTVSSSDLPLVQEPETAGTVRENAVLSDAEVPAPIFEAYIEYSPQGYVVMGIFTAISPDTSEIQPWYSTDGESWHKSESAWNLNYGGEEEGVPVRKYTQVCLYSNYEPLRSYLAGELDRIYVKLCITRGDGSTFETQTATIERGEPRPLPEDISAIARFDSSILVSQRSPYSNYGRYQLTVSTDATAEDIAGLLPNTLPVEIQFQGDNFNLPGCVVDCPVTWKPLMLPQLNAGESVTIPDAAEEIVVPEGTMVKTPVGVFELNETLRIDQFSNTDEVKLLLNVVAEDGNPTGVLRSNQGGVEMAFDLKPTGATAIHAYTYSDDTLGWVELSGLSLLKAVNSHPSAANSGYALVVGKDSELLRRCEAAEMAGEEPAPFYVGLKIEGGVYDGRQLILAWPDTYHVIPGLPNMRGTGGNEGNAGSDNKGDSTEGGQRPNLPQDSAETPAGGRPEQFEDSAESSEALSGQPRDPVKADTTERAKEESLSLEQSPDPGDESGGQRTDLSQGSEDGQAQRPREPQVRADADREEIRQTALATSGTKTETQIPEKTDSNTQISTQMSGHSLFGPILLAAMIAVSGISIIIITGRGALGREF